MSENDKLREAAQAVVDRWDTPLWKDVPHTAVYINRLREALAASKPEPQAQAAEPEVVAYGTWDSQLGQTHRLMKVRLDYGQDGCKEPLIPLQAHREAMWQAGIRAKAIIDGKNEAIAQRDAALDACVEIIRIYRNETPLGHQPHMVAHKADAAITKAQECRK